MLCERCWRPYATTPKPQPEDTTMLKTIRSWPCCKPVPGLEGWLLPIPLALGAGAAVWGWETNETSWVVLGVVTFLAGAALTLYRSR